MTCGKKLFKDLDRSLKSSVRIGNREYLEVQGKGTVVIESCTGTKFISDVLFVLEIDQNLLSVGQLVENGFKVMFEEGMCLILYFCSNVLFRIKMQNKSFSLNPLEEEQVAFKCQVSDSEFKVESESGCKIQVVNLIMGQDITHKGKMIVSRDVQFLEDEQWDWTSDAEEQKQELSLNPNELVDDTLIRGYEKAEDDKELMEAMKEELGIIKKNQTWELVERPTNRKVIGVKWVFRTKLNPDGSMSKYKARLEVKGYAQVWGVDFSKTFAFVARMDIIRMLLAMSAFLNEVLNEEIYVEQADGFITPSQEGKVFLLKKALYGLKQAPRAWYNKVDEHLLNIDFVKSLSESTLYVKKSGTNLFIVSLYVDDMLVTRNDASQIELFKKDMMEVFEITDLGEMHYLSGIEIKQNQNESVNTSMNQKEKLQKMDGANPADEKVYKSFVGCLMYLTSTRLDIMYIVSVLSRFLHYVSEIHMIAAKKALRYLKGTLAYGINFSKVEKFNLKGYFDSDWAVALDDMRSTSGYCFTFGLSCFSWCSRKQEMVNQSTAEVEFIAATTV
ncbi:Retrovirus-related Pol polyprotein from transposon TNT 1-94 [Gossypium australe]|uniref:Retrovirus-related Pol polyprotein from transposon TNT 1-94 n=1 Tax=Gossypium australe TaxID=47621 RepID=A0A5B6WLL2_9ROSI|nr:Retrovirus-related Pol polyprotein from transposon TNT 1-94 [Gossypium australe]